MKLYTKTGDDGTTGLYGGDRVLKTSLRIKAIGEVDELNAILGVVRLYSKGDRLDSSLMRIQNCLFDLGAELASPPGGKFVLENIVESHVIDLEVEIDQFSDELEPLKAFILPGGCELSAHLHFARSACRRVERAVIELNELEFVRNEVRLFLNRLSDWFFVAARTANYDRNVQDTEWKRSGNL